MGVDNSVAIAGGREWGGRRGHRGEMVVGGDLTWVVNTQHSVQMMCYRVVHLKPV